MGERFFDYRRRGGACRGVRVGKSVRGEEGEEGWEEEEDGMRRRSKVKGGRH